MPSHREAYYRHAAYYHTILQRAMTLYQGGGRSIKQGLALFDTEWLNIEAGFHWAVANRERDDTIAQLCSDFPLTGFDLLRLRRSPREHIIWHEHGFSAARQLNAVNSMLAHIGNIAVVYAVAGESQRSLPYHESLLTLTRTVTDRRLEAHILGNLGIAYTMSEQAERAVTSHQQQLTIARELENPHEELRALGGLGYAYKHINDLPRAKRYFKQALVRARKLKNRPLEAATLCELGLTCAQLGERTRALWLYTRARTIARSIGNVQVERAATWNMGLLYAQKGAVDHAIALMEPLVEYERYMGHTSAELNAGRLAQLKLIQPETSKDGRSLLKRLIDGLRRRS
jgi:tetratricopeptide (TPR) repeat protein